VRGRIASQGLAHEKHCRQKFVGIQCVSVAELRANVAEDAKENDYERRDRYKRRCRCRVRLRFM